MDPDLLIQQAHEAIAAGKDPQKVAAMYRELSGGQDLPSPAMAAGQIAPTPLQEEASPPNYLPAFASDAPTFTPSQAKKTAPWLIGAASMAVPTSGPLANLALQGATGAAMGATGAEPGHRKAGAIGGGLMGLGAGAASEVAGGLWGTLSKPARIGKALEKVNDLRKPYGAALYDPLNREINDAAVLKFLKDPAIKNDVAAVAQDVADGTRAPMMSDLQKLRTRWKVGRFKDAQAHQQLTGMMERIEPAIKAADAKFAQFSETGRALEKALPVAERTAKHAKLGLLAAGGLSYLKHGITGLFGEP